MVTRDYVDFLASALFIDYRPHVYEKEKVLWGSV